MKVFTIRRNMACLLFVLTVSLLCGLSIISSIARTNKGRLNGPPFVGSDR